MIVLDDGPDAHHAVTVSSRPCANMRSNASTTPAKPRNIGAATPSTTPTSPRRPGPAWKDPTRPSWFPRFDAELDNLRAAVAWALDAQAQADAELGLRIIAALVSQWLFRPSAGVGEWAEAALARAETSTPGRRCAVLTAAAQEGSSTATSTSRCTRASEALRDGLPPDTPSPGWAHNTLAIAHGLAGDHAGARRRARGTATVPSPPSAADDFAYLMVDIARRHDPRVGRRAR